MDRGEFPHLTDAQFESVRKMVGIFGGDTLRSLAAATLAKQVEHIEAFDTYEQWLITLVQRLQVPVVELKPAQPKPLRRKVNPYEGKERENLHFWAREVELAMDAALISTERLWVVFALSNLGGRAKTWAYTREATTPGCFTTWAQLCRQLRAASLPANYEYRQRSRFLACKQGKRELHEYIQEMRVLTTSLVGNPLPEHIKVTVFMDGLKVGPSRTQLFRVHANTMEEAIQIALQGPMELGTAVQSSIRCCGCGKLGHMQRACPAGGKRKFPSKPRGSRGPGQVSVRLADGTVVNVPGVRMDLAVKFEDFYSTESFLVLDMDKYALILGMRWLEKHETWVDWRSKAIGTSRPAVSDRALVSNILTSVWEWGASDGRQGAYAPEEVLGVTDSSEKVLGVTDTNEDVAMSLATVPQAGNIGPQAAEAAGEAAESASGVGNIVPRKIEETKKKNESAACVSSVGNEVPRGVNKTSTRVEASLSTSRVDNQVPHSESETPPARPVEGQCHVFDGVSGHQVRAGAVHLEALPEVSALRNLEELSMKDFLAELKAEEIAEMVLLKPETSPKDLNSSSVTEEYVLEGFTKVCNALGF
ncbi:Gag protein [Phytophthora palmivora]|uniref:Gag protein n=1 Tax=Phytophthora palmivora TaxID=4796 RepID=A0A2P4XZ08_9STRA|nr:Gag protein [Phytophthora palmivora]